MLAEKTLRGHPELFCWLCSREHFTHWAHSDIFKTIHYLKYDYNSILTVLLELQHNIMTTATVHVIQRNPQLAVISAGDVGGNSPPHAIIKSPSSHRMPPYSWRTSWSKWHTFMKHLLLQFVQTSYEHSPFSSHTYFTLLHISHICDSLLPHLWLILPTPTSPCFIFPTLVTHCSHTPSTIYTTRYSPVTPAWSYSNTPEF